MDIFKLLKRVENQLLIIILSSSLFTQNSYALNCPEVRHLTLLYFKMHYSYDNYNDELSKRTLDNFVKLWDPGKLYFLSSDIKEFEAKYGTKLDDMINRNDCSGIDYIMGRYSQRYEEVQPIIKKHIQSKYDFTKDEYMIVDRKKLEYADGIKDLSGRWRQRVKFQLLSLKTTLEDMKKAREKLAKRYKLALKRHNELTKDKVYGVFLNAFSTGLDPHSNYMPADDLEDFRIRTRLSLEGIGASLRSEDGFTIVVNLVKGGAAQKGGLLEENDKIIAVAQGDGEPVDVIDMDLQEVVKMIRGPRGTMVKLTVMREGTDKTAKLVIPIVREKIQLVDQQAKSDVVSLKVSETPKNKKDYKVGVITLPSFYIDFEGRHRRLKDYRSSSRDTRREIAKLQKEGVDAIVIDLRSNGGGSLEESIKMAGLFFDKGPVVQVKTQEGSITAYDDTDDFTYYKGPLVIMINRHSASASEIFAGAIQDYGRGLIVGDSHTFGKGTVQNLNDVAARLGAVKVTVNQFYRASGATTQLNGVSSDIRLPSLVDELEIGEKYYDYALPYEKIAAVKHEQFTSVKPYVKTLSEISAKRTRADKEFKEIFEEIEKYQKNVEERSRVSLKEKEKDKDKKKKEDKKKEDKKKKDKKKKDKKKKDKKKKDDDSSADEDTFDLKDDIYLQETLRITADYLQLLNKRKVGTITIPELEAKKVAETVSEKKVKGKK